MKKDRTSNPLGIEVPEAALASRKILLQLAAIVTIGLTAWIWFGIFSAQNVEDTLYVLDVGQGDSQLVILEGEGGGPPVKILIDGGKDRMVLTALDEALGSSNNKYLDIVIMTHTDLDHMGGLVEVATRYDIGLFISNGREAGSDAYIALQDVLAERDIPSEVLIEGDVVRYGGNTLSILSPDRVLLVNKEVNEASIVLMLKSEDANVLFTGDIGFPAENMLLKKYRDLSADILKVGHHGSKNSSSENFIAAVRPLVSTIGVGKNSYGHPTPRVLDTLDLAGSRVYRTDEDGTIQIPLTDDAVSAEPPQKKGLLASIGSILTGSYKEASMTTVSLHEVRKAEPEFALTPYKECSFKTEGAPRHSPVIFNEVAWMGASSGTTHEWLELRNISGKPVNVSGWQVVNENERLHFTFPQASSLDSQFAVLARSAANDALSLGTKFIFTGSLRNTREGLRLFDNDCMLIDEIPLASSWPAGDNKTKQTMERTSDLSWKTSANPGGTPGR
ncbi:MBL fold metallo-hydrolase [Candidatus Parcubacteria bacterium]|nr:MAG: MBL fold metallo-hydrolase [Candidatus Parcubacteria bacterium]